MDNSLTVGSVVLPVLFCHVDLRVLMAKTLRLGGNNMTSLTLHAILDDSVRSCFCTCVIDSY